MNEYAKWMALGQQAPVGEFFEDVLTDLYLSIVSMGDTVLDGGAHQGRHTVPLSSRVGRMGHVVAVEPIPDLASALALRCQNNFLSNVTVEGVALGSSEGETYFHVNVERLAMSAIHLRPDMLPTGDVERIRVPMKTIDGLLSKRRSRVSFLKLDLEGAELDAMLGAAEIMTTEQPIIVFEDGRHFAGDWHQHSMHDYFDLFASRGYQVVDLLGRVIDDSTWHANEFPWYSVAIPPSVAVERVQDLLHGACERAAEAIAGTHDERNVPEGGSQVSIVLPAPEFPATVSRGVFDFDDLLGFEPIQQHEIDYITIHETRYRETLETFRETFSELAGQTVVSLGGISRFEKWLAREFDFDLKVVASDVRMRSEIADNSCAGVLCLEVIEHLHDLPVSAGIQDIFTYSGIRAMLEETSRILSPGGAFFLTTPNAVNAIALAQLISGMNPMRYVPHVRELTPSELTDFLEASGFRIEKFRTFFAWGNPSPVSIEQSLRLIAENGGPIEHRGDDMAVLAIKSAMPRELPTVAEEISVHGSGH